MRRGRTRWLFPSLLGSGLALLPALPAPAQTPTHNQGLVVRDGTLGGGLPGVVQPDLDDLGQHADYLIRADLGEQHGGNLFHSFARFSIGSGERATFTNQGALNPGAIDNVISRVTGGLESRIDGTLHSTIPGADVWLLNPSGVVFGEGAQLDVPGSFHASTGDYLDFGEGELVRFYVDSSRESVLSTAPPAAFGFLGDQGAASLAVDGAKLAVTRGEVALIGADVLLAGADVMASGGHVSFDAHETVGLSDSRVDVSGETPGSVSIRGGAIVIEDSQVLAENHGAGPGGRIDVLAQGSLDVNGGVLRVSTDSVGEGGTIDLKGDDIVFRNGPGLLDLDHPFRDPSDPRNQPHEVAVGASAGTFGSGAGGTIRVDARSLRVVDGATLGAYSGGASATGRGGQILIDAGSVEVRDRAAIGAGAWGSQGDGGAVVIHAGTLTLDGADQFAFIDTSIQEHLPQPASYGGAPGTVEITAGSIAILNGGTIQNVCFQCTSKTEDRSPDAALTRIHADHMIIDGSNGHNRSYVIGRNQGTDGDGARIEIQVSGALELTHGGAIFDGVGLGATGSGGSITIDAGSLTVAHEAQIHAGADPGSSGDADTITIHVGTLIVAEKGVINTTTFGDGRAGTIDVIATESILLSDAGGAPFDLDRPLTGIFSATFGGGDAGSVTLESPDITIADGAIVASSTLFGGGDGGDVTLQGTRILIGDGAFVDTTSLASPGSDAGRVTLTASESIEVFGHHPEDAGQPSRVASASLGSAGDAGAVTLRAPRIVLRDGGTIATNAETADGGDVTIQAKQLLHLDAGEITAAVNGGPGTTGGNITIDPEVVVLENGSRIVAQAAGGSGGKIQITADNYFAFPGSVVSAEADRQELSGIVEVHTPDVDLAGKLTTLPTTFLDAASLMRERCAARRSGERAGSFSVRGNGGIPAEPDGWLPAAVGFEVAPEPLGMASEARTVAIAPASLGASRLFARSGCR